MVIIVPCPPQQPCLRRTQTKSEQLGSPLQKTDEMTLSVCVSSNALLGKNIMLKPGVWNHSWLVSYQLKIAAGGRSLKRNMHTNPKASLWEGGPGCPHLSWRWRRVGNSANFHAVVWGVTWSVPGSQNNTNLHWNYFGNGRKNAIMKSRSKWNDEIDAQPVVECPPMN